MKVTPIGYVKQDGRLVVVLPVTGKDNGATLADAAKELGVPVEGMLSQLPSLEGAAFSSIEVVVDAPAGRKGTEERRATVSPPLVRDAAHAFYGKPENTEAKFKNREAPAVGAGADYGNALGGKPNPKE